MSKPPRTNRRSPRSSAKQELSAEAAEKLYTVLRSQKRLENYPLPLRRLLELADQPVPEPLLSETFHERLTLLSTAKTKPQQLQSAVILAEDVPRIGGQLCILRHLMIRSFGKGKTRACTIASLVKKGLPKPVQQALYSQLQDRLANNHLPPGVGAILLQGKHYLFLFDEAVGGPAPPSAVPAAPGSGEPGSRTPETLPAAPVALSMRRCGADDDDSADDAAVPPESLPRRMLETFDRLDARGGNNNLVLLHDMRAELGVSREEFDECLRRLRADGILSLSPSEGRFRRLPPEMLDSGVDGPSGKLVYATRR